MTERYLKCKADDCFKNAHYTKSGTNGHCSMHAARLSRHGHIEKTRASPGDALDWFNSHKNYDGDGCLTWPFYRLSNGYAGMTIDGRGASAGRVMCEAVHGPPPFDYYQAAHSCGKGHEACIHPKHLRWATPSENNQDKKEHKTDLSAERSKIKKLTWEDVRKIRALAGTMSNSKIAKLFPVGRENIGYIVRGITWKEDEA